MVGIYYPTELFDETGKLVPEMLKLHRKGDCRIMMNPITAAGVSNPEHAD